VPVIARSDSDEAIHLSACGGMDCLAPLAMTEGRQLHLVDQARDDGNHFSLNERMNWSLKGFIK
jgi:hypothetical protein